MDSAHSIQAGQVMNTEPETVSVDQSLSQVKNRMEQNRLRAIPVLDENGDFEGAVGYRELVRFIQFNPSKTRLERVIHSPPKFDSSDSLVEVADLRINSGRKMLVNVEEGRLEGVIGNSEFLNAFERVRELKDVTTRDLSVHDVFMVEESETVERARHMMLDNNISRLPVIDQGKLTGKIDSIDILRAMVPIESQNAGGTSGNRSGDQVNITGGTEKKEMADITVDQLMQSNPCRSEQHFRADRAVEKMLEKEAFYIIFTEGNYPEQIITVKDLIDFIAKLKQRNTVLVQLAGVDVAEEKAAIHRKIRTQLQGSLGRKIKKPEEITLRIKKAEKDGKRHRYELSMGLKSEYGYITVEEEGWELLDVLDTLLENLNRIIRDKKEKKSDHRK